jgi:hypothetical protein
MVGFTLRLLRIESWMQLPVSKSLFQVDETAMLFQGEENGMVYPLHFF